MYRRCFFKYLLLFLLFFVGSASFVFSLSPSYLFLGNNRINTSNANMVLLVTPSKDYSSNSSLTIFFPDGDDGKWCKYDDSNIPVDGVTSSIVSTQGWQIEQALPGTLSARCYQGLGVGSHDRIVITGIDNLTGSVSYGVEIGPSANLSTGLDSGSNNVIVQLTRGLESESIAFAVYLRDSEGMLVTAFVNQDTFSTVEVLDPTVEKGIWSRVRVRILDSKGNPISGRSIELGLDLPNLDNWEIEQPVGLTNSNGVVQGRIRGFESRIVKVIAFDNSLSQKIYIQDFDWLTVTEVATITLHQLPMYTPGLSRQITWNTLPGSYEYFVEASLDPNFQNIVQTSGWITGGQHTFNNLEHGKAYYYRAKVRNIANVESAYSNVVTSIQAEKPIGIIEVLDPIVEQGIWSRVRVTVLDSQGNPMSGRRIILNIDRSGSNWQIEQPINLTNSNGVTEGRIRGFEAATVKVTAVDRTTSPDLHLEGFDWLQVIAIPTINLHTLPRYSPGLSRLVTWNLLPGNYQYYIESSTNANFSTVNGSGWISLNQYLFENLTHGQGYFYRAKVRNSANVESGYSNIVWSIQDNEAPLIEEVLVETFLTSAGGRLRLDFLITDLSRVSLVEFYCEDKQGQLFKCGSISSLGNFHYVTINEADLRDFKISGNRYFLKYCVEAEDIVGNRSRFCSEKTFTFEGLVPIEEEPRAPFEIRERFRDNIEVGIGFIQDLELDDPGATAVSISVLLTVIPLTVISFLMNFANVYLFGQSLRNFILFFKRKKKALPYGYVYDAITKEPINRAIVRIFRRKKLISTVVTNVYGIFTASLDAGEYFIKVFSSGYSYPSKLITGNVDPPLENIYRGEEFVIDEEEYVQYSIPLDPLEYSRSKFAKTLVINRLKNFFLSTQKFLIIFGLLIAFFLYLRLPDTLNLIILIFYIPLVFFHLVLFFDSRRFRIGYVKDGQGRILQNLVLGLREMKFEKIVAKRVTDEKGRYKFLVPGAKYKLEVLTPDYEIVSLKGSDLIFVGHPKKPLLVNKNLIVERKKKEEV